MDKGPSNFTNVEKISIYGGKYDSFSNCHSNVIPSLSDFFVENKKAHFKLLDPITF